MFEVLGDINIWPFSNSLETVILVYVNVYSFFYHSMWPKISNLVSHREIFFLSCKHKLQIHNPLSKCLYVENSKRKQNINKNNYSLGYLCHPDSL